jgi:hypothetical protein
LEGEYYMNKFKENSKLTEAEKYLLLLGIINKKRAQYAA